MDDLIIISNLNDFIFCPASIYFHKLYGSGDTIMYQSKAQLDGTKAHEKIVDNIVNDLTNTFEKRFSQSDSVYIFKLSSSCEVLRYGYAKNEENDFFIIT